MQPGWKFICETKATPRIAEAFVALQSHISESKVRYQFIKKQLEDLEETRTKLWRDLFDEAVKEGKIPAGTDYEKVAMQFSDDKQQLFMGPRDDGPPAFIKALLGL